MSKPNPPVWRKPKDNEMEKHAERLSSRRLQRLVPQLKPEVTKRIDNTDRKGNRRIQGDNN